MDARRLCRGSLLVLATALAAVTITGTAAAAGDGTFTAAPDSPFGAGSTPTALGVIDFNGDGDPDIVAVNRDSPDLTFLVGAAGAGFGSSPVSAPPAGAHRADVAVGDLTGDGVADLVVSNPTVDGGGSPGVTIFLANGGVLTPTTVNLGQNPSKLAIADFDGDGDRDIAVTTPGNERFAVLTNNGAGTFTVASIDNSTGDGPTAIATGDFNADGDPDLAVTSFLNNSVTIILGAAGATFTRQPTAPAVGTQPSDVAAGDFNGDGDPDLVVTNAVSDDLTILLGQAGGAGFQASETIAVGDGPSSVLATDLNGNGDPDLVVTNQAPGTTNGSVSILLGGSGATFAPAPGSPIASTTEPLAVASGDFDIDADVDLAVADGANDTVSVLLGNGPGGGADRTPPVTTIDSGPKKKTEKTKAKIRYSANEQATFECRLKGKSVDSDLRTFTDCGAAKIKYKRLDPGKKKFQVRATDAAGNVDRTPAKLKWKVLG